MAVQRTIPFRIVLADLRDYFSPPDSNWIAKMVEACGRAMEYIGYHAGTERVKTDLNSLVKVTDHRGLLPKSCVILHGVQFRLSSDYDLIRLPKGTDNTGYSYACDDEYTVVNSAPPEDKILPESEGIDFNTKIAHQGHYYQLNPDYAVTTFPTGELRFHYSKFIVDKDGMPMIVDEIHYREAITWFCVRQMILLGYKHADRSITFERANAMFKDERDWASNVPIIMDMDDAENFMNMWTRTAFPTHMGEDFFRGGENKEYTNRR